MEFDLLFALGFIGAFVQLIAFVLNIRGKLSHDSVYYASANAFGCVMTSGYAFATNDIPFLMLEFTWGLASFHKLYGLVTKKKNKMKR